MACFLTTVYMIIKYYFMAHFVQKTNKQEKFQYGDYLKLIFFIVKEGLLFNYMIIRHYF